MPQEPLSPGQIEFYHENGFVVLGPLFDEAELGSLRRAADELVEKSGPVVVGNPRLEIEKERLDGGMVIRKIEPVIDVVPALKDLVYDPRVAPVTLGSSRSSRGAVIPAPGESYLATVAPVSGSILAI